MALNPKDAQGDRYTVWKYPHAIEREYGFLDEFAAANAIDGKKSRARVVPVVGESRTDLWLNVDFGCEVEIDKAVIWRADFPRDGVWKSATLEFSDGSREDRVERRRNRRRLRSISAASGA